MKYLQSFDFADNGLRHTHSITTNSLSNQLGKQINYNATNHPIYSKLHSRLLLLHNKIVSPLSNIGYI